MKGLKNWGIEKWGILCFVVGTLFILVLKCISPAKETAYHLVYGLSFFCFAVGGVLFLVSMQKK